MQGRKLCRKRLTALAAALALCALLYTGCGASAGGTASSAAAAAPSENQEAAAADAALGTQSISLAEALPENRKIILNADVQMESTDFDASCQALRQAAAQAGGYLESSQQETPSYEDAERWTRFTFRIPADRYEDFLSSTDAAGNVTSLSETSQDITADYVDVEARIEALTTQQERLMTMMEQAGDLETLLAIQNQLTDVQYELERYEGQRRVYDDQVSYSTVTVTVEEVVYLTQPAETFAQRLGSAFTDSWRDFGTGLQGLLISLVYLLLLLLVAGAAAVCVALALRAHHRRHLRRLRPPRAPRIPAQYGPSYGPQADARPPVEPPAAHTAGQEQEAQHEADHS